MVPLCRSWLRLAVGISPSVVVPLAGEESDRGGPCYTGTQVGLLKAHLGLSLSKSVSTK